MYQIEISDRAERDIEKLDQTIRERVRSAIAALADDPRPAGCIKLKGKGQASWRIRVGQYRVLYDIKDQQLLVVVVAAGPRDDIYKRHF